jgi:hypothetical protein
MSPTLAKARDALLTASGFLPGEGGWDPLRQETLRLERTVTEPQLLALV